jgi:hypothetical protein
MVEWWLNEGQERPNSGVHSGLEYEWSAICLGRAIQALGSDRSSSRHQALTNRLFWFWSWVYLGAAYSGGKVAHEEPPTRADIEAEREQWAHALRHASQVTPELNDLLDEVRAHLDDAVSYFPKSEDEEGAA